MNKIFPLAVLGAAIACTLPAAPAVTQVILSTDVGNEIDDQWAIVYMLTNPKFEVLGLVSAHAPSLTAPAAHTSYRILRDVVEKRLGMAVHPPLFEGSSLPLESKTQPQPSEGADFILQSSKAFGSENRLTVVTIGAVTDVASAILKDPSIVDRIRVIDMGFNDWANGGDEYNVANDVLAMQVVLSSNVPLVVGAGDVCRATLSLSFDQAKHLIAQHGPVGAWLWDEYQAWYFRHVKPLRKNDFSKPWIIWDTITLAYLLDMTTSVTHPRPVLRDDMKFEHVETDRTVTWITGLDSQKMWADFIEKLDTYQRTHALSAVASYQNGN